MDAWLIQQTRPLPPQLAISVSRPDANDSNDEGAISGWTRVNARQLYNYLDEEEVRS